MRPAALVKLTVYENPPRGDAGGSTQLARFRRAGDTKARQLELDGRSVVPRQRRLPDGPRRSQRRGFVWAPGSARADIRRQREVAPSVSDHLVTTLKGTFALHR